MSEQTSRNAAGNAFKRAFGDRVRQIQFALKMTQQELAEALGASSNMVVSRLERGDVQTIRINAIPLLIALAEDAGHSAQWLLTGNDVPSGSPAGHTLDSLIQFLTSLRDGALSNA